MSRHVDAKIVIYIIFFSDQSICQYLNEVPNHVAVVDNIMKHVLSLLEINGCILVDNLILKIGRIFQ